MSRPSEPPKPAESDDPLQRVMPLMVTAQGDHDVARWARAGAEWQRRQTLVGPDERPWTPRQAAESIEADVLAGRL